MESELLLEGENGDNNLDYVVRNEYNTRYLRRLVIRKRVFRRDSQAIPPVSGGSGELDHRSCILKRE